MPIVLITDHEELPSSYEEDGEENGGYRRYRFCGHYDNPETIASGPFVVITEGGQYDYEQSPDGIEDEERGDEPIQIAIGEYMEEHGIDPGIVSR